MSSLIQRACETARGLLALGHERIASPWAWLVRNAEFPRVYEANFAAQSDFRGRGIATALINTCVEDARARGAGPVIVGARSEDTLKEMYAALGFRPLCAHHGYLKRGRCLDK